MTEMNRSKCNKCGSELVWCTLSNGMRIPLDVKPKKLIQVKEGIGKLIDVYEFHFVTCAGTEKVVYPLRDQGW
jgi:hypothetical protein